MNFLSAIILGLVQGLAEFLPISSSGHLSLFQHFFGLQTAEATSLFFDVLLHMGTLVAVIIYYWEDVRDMVSEFIAMCFELAGKRSSRPTAQAMSVRRLVLLIIVATLPLIIVLPFKSKIETLYDNTWFVGFALLVTGCILFLSDRLAKGRKTERSATIRDVALVGLAQAFATFPGISRSGSTIAAGMVLGFDRKFAVRFSFLLSLPAVLGANLLNLIDAFQAGVELGMIPVYIVGVCVAAMAGYFAIGVVKRLTDEGRFGKFAYYCWGVGALTLLLSLISMLVNR
ncbi:MAG: undecaprenyl-diphosphate phosphatase [Oscillospiraceae bacterium]|nr:undecaprenyl-diphosphate phosphatase [Oscillospiraceae bacterium]